MIRSWVLYESHGIVGRNIKARKWKNEKVFVTDVVTLGSNRPHSSGWRADSQFSDADSLLSLSSGVKMLRSYIRVCVWTSCYSSSLTENSPLK